MKPEHISLNCVLYQKIHLMLYIFKQKNSMVKTTLVASKKHLILAVATQLTQRLQLDLSDLS